MKLNYLNKVKVVSSNTIRQVLMAIFGIITPFFVIKFSSKELWGELVSIILYALIASQFINWGNKEYLLRLFSNSPSKIKKTFSSISLTRIPMLVLFSMGSFFLFGLDLGLLISILLLGRFLTQTFEILVIYNKEFNTSIIIEIVTFLLFILALLFFSTSLNFWIVTLLYSLYNLCKGIGYILAFRKQLTFKEINFNFSYYKVSFWFFILSLMGFLTSKIDLYIVDIFLDSKDLAHYQIINSLLLFTMSLAYFIYAPYTKNIYRSKSGVLIKFKKTLFILGLVVVPIALTLIYFILEIKLDIQFGITFYILAGLYILPSYIYGIDIILLFKKKREKEVIKHMCVCVFTNALFTSILLHYSFDIIGALTGAAISQILVMILFKLSLKDLN